MLVLGTWDGESLPTMVSNLLEVSDWYGPVSYTHLDVYKRQLFYFLILSQAYVEYGQHNIGLFARLVRRIPQVLTGIAMTIGGIFGIVQTIGSLWTKNSDTALM